MKKNGVMECWSIGVMQISKLSPFAGISHHNILVLHHSTTPLLQHSNFSHHSITPTLHYSVFFAC
jgi:hypothetical protein